MPRGRQTTRRERFLTELLTQPTVSDAARAAGISEPTAYRWMGEPEFRDEYRQARRRVLEKAIGRLQGAAARAVETLVKNLDAEKPSDQIRAALGILENAVGAAELQDLLERVVALEERIGDGGG